MTSTTRTGASYRDDLQFSRDLLLHKCALINIRVHVRFSVVHFTTGLCAPLCRAYGCVFVLFTRNLAGIMSFLGM
jgi:hypothetical protein